MPTTTSTSTSGARGGSESDLLNATILTTEVATKIAYDTSGSSGMFDSSGKVDGNYTQLINAAGSRSLPTQKQVIPITVKALPSTKTPTAPPKSSSPTVARPLTTLAMTFGCQILSWLSTSRPLAISTR